MTITQFLVIMLSALGGVLFFAAGFLLARSGILPRFSSPSVGARVPEEAIKTEVSSVNTQSNLAGKEVVEKAGDDDVFRRELDKNKERLREAEKRIAQMEPLEEERYALREQHIALKATIEDLREKTAITEQNRKEFAAKLTVKETEVEDLREQEIGLSQRLAESGLLTQELTEKVHKLEDERQDLLVDLERLVPRLSELDRCQERVRILQLSLGELDDLKKSAEELRVENARLHSLELAHKATPPRPSLPQEPGVLAQSLNGLLERLSSSKGSRGAVVADEHGLLVAGTGDHTDALAVIAAIYDEIAERVPDMLPVSTVPQINIVDENDVTIAVRPIFIDSDRLILVSLSVGPGPEQDVVDEFIRQPSPALASEGLGQAKVGGEGG